MEKGKEMNEEGRRRGNSGGGLGAGAEGGSSAGAPSARWHAAGARRERSTLNAERLTLNVAKERKERAHIGARRWSAHSERAGSGAYKMRGGRLEAARRVDPSGQGSAEKLGDGFSTGGNEESEGHKDLERPASLRCLILFCSKSEGSSQRVGELISASLVM